MTQQGSQPSFSMPLVAILFAFVLPTLHTPAYSAARSTISAGEALIGDDKLVSRNRKFALGFFQPGSEYSSQQTPSHWYLGIWFNKIPKVTPVWVANRESPIVDHRMSEFTISKDGNLVILNRATKSTVWSTHANITANKIKVVLMHNGNLILGDASNSSNIIWQSFDYPTDGTLPGAKQGLDKVTGLNRRLVSKKSLIDPAPGRYCLELDTTGPGQFLSKLCNSSIVYWSTGEWNGHYFNSMPEMSGHNRFNFSFVNNDKEEYFVCSSVDERVITVSFLDITGQHKQLLWHESSQDWVTVYTQPKDQCDVYATCGPFTICNSNTDPVCGCMKGFSIRSPKDWELEDRSGGCIRNTPLDCGTRNQSRDATTDKFYSMTGVTLPAKASVIEAVGSIDHCAQACLYNCSCTAYSYGNTCSVWYDGLFNIKQGNLGTTSDGEILYLRIAAKDAESWSNKRRGKKITGVVTATSVVALGLLTAFVMWFILIWRNRRKQSVGVFNNVQGGNGIIVFRYIDLQHATKNFSEMLGGGSFGSVFKGLISDSTVIAVKRLDGVRQGEKEFRAEVSSIGIIQHINLVKLIGFCCEGNRRLLVYEYMPNRSLDAYLFRSNTVVLNWSVRYQIALGIARGLAYLHENCRDCIIHCDIKPQNILLDTSFVPKVADFGMAKFLGRDFSRVLTTVRGTIGYLAPEWISGVAITPKVDVYSYGMMLLEIVSGRSNTCKGDTSTGDHLAYFPVQFARKLLEGDLVSLLDDKVLSDVNMDEAERVCKVACWCIQDGESNRPTMGEVVEILEGLLELEIPPIPRLLQAIVGDSP